MAQIKKFQTPAGPITTAEEKTTPKYGRLIQNGIAIEATDDMIGWLNSQGYYGQQMASNLKNGVDQYVDVDKNGVGSIKNIQIENPDLNERQQNKTARRRRGLEGRRMSEARGAIDTLAGYDYSKFKVTPTAKKTYNWDNLEIDYNESTENGKTKYTFSDAGVNKDILARLDSLEKGLIIPEGYEFAKADEIRSYYSTIKDKIDGVKTNLQAGTLTDNDLDILNTLGIYQKGQLKSETNTTDTKNLVVGELVSKLGMTEDQAKQVVNDFDFGEDGSMIAKQSITNKFGKNYLFGERKKAKNSGLIKLLLVFSFIWISLYTATSSLVTEAYWNFGNMLDSASENFGSVVLFIVAEALVYWLAFELVFYLYRFVLQFKIYSFIVPMDNLKNESRLYYVYRNVFYGLFMNLCFIFPFLHIYAPLVSLITTFVMLILYLINFILFYICIFL